MSELWLLSGNSGSFFYATLKKSRASYFGWFKDSCMMFPVKLASKVTATTVTTQ